VDQYGQRVFGGDAAPDQVFITDQVTELISNYEGTFASAAYYADYSGLEVFVKESETQGLDELQKLLGDIDPDGYVHLVSVAHSMDDLIAASEVVSEAAQDGVTVYDVGPDVVNNAVSVSVDIVNDSSRSFGNAHALSRELSALTTSTALGTQSGGSSIDVIMIGGASDAVEQVTRSNDFSPFYAGGQLNVPPGDSGGSCSLGLPVDINGKFYGMTAAHCTKTAYYNPNGVWSGLNTRLRAEEMRRSMGTGNCSVGSIMR